MVWTSSLFDVRINTLAQIGVAKRPLMVPGGQRHRTSQVAVGGKRHDRLCALARLLGAFPWTAPSASQWREATAHSPASSCAGAVRRSLPFPAPVQIRGTLLAVCFHPPPRVCAGSGGRRGATRPDVAALERSADEAAGGGGGFPPWPPACAARVATPWPIVEGPHHVALAVRAVCIRAVGQRVGILRRARDILLAPSPHAHGVLGCSGLDLEPLFSLCMSGSLMPVVGRACAASARCHRAQRPPARFP